MMNTDKKVIYIQRERVKRNSMRQRIKQTGIRKETEKEIN